MTFQLSEDQQQLRKEVREFGQEHIRPVARQYDESGEYPREIFELAADRGFVGPTIPEEYGGAGHDLLSSAVLTEEMWRADTGIGWALGLTGFSTNVYVLTHYGDDWMCEEWLPKIAAGEINDAIAVTEPNHGSNVAGIESTARREGDEWVLEGEKKWIGNAPVADMVVVFAKTDPEAGHRGISAFLVPADTDGFSTEAIDDIHGGHTAPVGRIFLDDVRVPAENLVGEENQGFYYFMESLAYGRIIVGAQAVGAASAALEAAKEYTTNREQFGQPVSEFQAVQHHFAEMATKIEAARSLLYRATEHVMVDSEEANRLASMAKLFATERASEVTDTAMQVHGGNGYHKDYDVERYHRDVRVTRIYEGASDIQRNIIADDVL